MSDELSIYIHWPFCKSKCPYCDFNSHVRSGIDNKRWQNALLHELHYYASKLPGRQAVSVFFGGGTPSLMEAETVKALIDAIGELWKADGNMEITLEANPTSIEAQKFRNFRSAGVNRVSIGIQALSGDALRFLGREHNVDEALQAISLAQDIFPRMSFDLIYARPGQTLKEWESELAQALKYAKDHISLYQLTIEENTAFYHAYRDGKFVMPEDFLAADMYMLTQDIMEANGLPAYEISNHARPGYESRHNLAYWRSQDYIGIGPGAHGRYRVAGASPEVSEEDDALPPYNISRLATENIKSPERWLEKVESSGNGLSAEVNLSEKEIIEEKIMMGLRLSSGISYGAGMRETISEKAENKLKSLGLIASDNNSIKVTRQGRLLLNSIIRELLAA